jgi:hypothetical protein
MLTTAFSYGEQDFGVHVELSSFSAKGSYRRWADDHVEHEAGIAEIVIPIFSTMLHLPFHFNDLASVSTSQPRCVMEKKGMP